MLAVRLALFDINGVVLLMRELEGLLPNVAPRRRASSLRVLAELYRAQGDYERALTLAQRARTTIQSARRNATRAGNLRQMADCWLFEGVVRRARGEYDLALQAYRNARPLFELANYALGIARAIANTGLVYWTMGLYADARQHYNEALPRFQQLGAEWDGATCTLNLAILTLLIEYALTSDALTILQRPSTERRVACTMNSSARWKRS